VRQGWIYRYGTNVKYILAQVDKLAARYTDGEQLALAAFTLKTNWLL
jgi:hypothetical protein